MVSQETLLVAVQSHPAVVVTAIVFVPPTAGTDWKSGVTLKAHDDAEACVTVNVCPAIVSVPVRVVPVEFAAAEKVTSPFAVPDAPAVMVSQVALLVAVHVHPLAELTVTEPEPPTEATL